MPNTLGLHIGITSIGWALMDSESKSIKAMGTHVFPHGSKKFDFGNREISNRTQRRMQRIIRLRYARKRKRKIKLLQILSENGLCPVDQKDLNHWRQSKEFPLGVLQSWLNLNPYALRVKALEEEISLLELGRILYHMTQRRGFPLSQRSMGGASNTLFKGYPRSNRPGISHLQPHLRNQYLGQYLAMLYPLPYQSYQHTGNRIRNRFIARAMYQEEIERIWDTQKKFHPTLSTTLKTQLIGGTVNGQKVTGAVFFQRPLKSQKHKVGRCMYEPNKTKCCVSSLTYQELLAYRWANTILKDGHPLSPIDRDQVARYFLTHRKFSFQAIIDILGDSNSFYNKKTNEIIIGSFVFSEMVKPEYFGTEWFAFDEKTQEDIWHVLYFFKDKKKVADYAEHHWGFGTQQAHRISRISIDKRYAPISRKAARNILYFLKHGVNYDLAVVLAGVKNALHKQWDAIAEKDVRFIISKVIDLYHSYPVFGFTQHLQEFLMEYLQLTDFQISKLYGKSARILDTNTHSTFEFSKEADDEVYRFHNPTMITSLFQTRKIINALVKRYGPIAHLNIQLNPKLKVNKYQRYFYKLDARRISQNHERYIGELGALRENITPANILKFELWEECRHTCPYTGEEIPLDRLFTQEYKIVYIHPWSRSLNDATINKTLCVERIHEKLKNLTPFEYFKEHRPYDWDEVVDRAARLFANSKEFPASYKKFRRFVKRYYRRNILKHHLQDPSFMSQELRCFFTQVCPDVTVALSHSTKHLMEQWRLDKILTKDGSSSDYRMTALKAYITSVRDTEILGELTQWDRYRKGPRKIFPEPYPNFRDQVEYHLKSIYVSHAQSKRITVRRKVFNPITKGRHLGVAVRGMLHKETIYSLRKAPDEKVYSYHIRKPVESFQSESQVDKIVDPNVKKAVLKAILAAGGFRDGKVPTNALVQSDKEGFKVPRLFMPNKRGGDAVPVWKIRIKENFSGAVQLKPNLNKYVNPKNNHHILVYKDGDGQFQESVVSLWEAVRRKTQGEPLYQIPDPTGTYVSSLHKNDLFLLGISNLEEDLSKESRNFLAQHLYRLQKMSSKLYEFRLAYHDELSKVTPPEFFRITNFGKHKTGWLTVNPIKVTVDFTGELSRVPNPQTVTNPNPSMLH